MNESFFYSLVVFNVYVRLGTEKGGRNGKQKSKEEIRNNTKRGREKAFVLKFLREKREVMSNKLSRESPEEGALTYFGNGIAGPCSMNIFKFSK